MRIKLIAGLLAASTLLAAVACYLLWLATGFLPPHLLDQCDSRGNSRDTAPIVVVGVLTSDTLALRPIPMHSDPKSLLQLRKLRVRVENVLKGAPISETIAVYYFTWAGAFDGPRPLGFWRVGDRRILWLRRDSGVLRTACDGWDGCTEGVWSGAHPDYRPDPRKPLDYALVDLHFTRGKGHVNEIGFVSRPISLRRRAAGDHDWSQCRRSDSLRGALPTRKPLADHQRTKGHPKRA